jgi:hypothetical protein
VRKRCIALAFDLLSKTGCPPLAPLCRSAATGFARNGVPSSFGVILPSLPGVGFPPPDRLATASYAVAALWSGLWFGDTALAAGDPSIPA